MELLNYQFQLEILGKLYLIIMSTKSNMRFKEINGLYIMLLDKLPL